MEPYRRRQRGRLIRVTVGTAIFFLALFLRGLGPAQMTPLIIAASVLALMVLILIAFHSLTVEVDDQQIRIAYGPGWIRFKFATAEVVEALAVRNRWYYGWGIRLTPYGWLYNVSGFDAVQIRMRSGKTYRIGTDDPDGLLAAIERVAPLERT